MFSFLTFLGFATIHYSIFWKIGFLQHIILASLSSNYSRIRNFFILRQFLPISYPSKLSWVNCKVTTIYRSSHPEVFCNKVFLEFCKIHRKTPVPVSFLIMLQASGQSLLFNKVAGLRPATCNCCFPVNFLKFLRTTWKTSNIYYSYRDSG